MKNSYPVIFFVYKRPASTIPFLDLIKQADIKKIYIFADGPRKTEDKIETDKVRFNISIFSQDNPNIKIITKYSATNIGLKQNIINGLNHVFRSEKAAIIIEDDCQPTQDFFRFTSTMLDKYANNDKIMSINGTSTGGEFHSSYDFTKYSQCWGWATWSRAWKLYDSDLKTYNPQHWNMLANIIGMNTIMKWYWRTMLTVVKAGMIDTWDFQWSYAHFYHGGLAISPSVNLIKNIGFDKAATNTKTKTSTAAMLTTAMRFPLTDPKIIRENLSVSSRIESYFYANPVAILGLLRKYIYLIWRQNAHRN